MSTQHYLANPVLPYDFSAQHELPKIASTYMCKGLGPATRMNDASHGVVEKKCVPTQQKKIVKTTQFFVVKHLQLK